MAPETGPHGHGHGQDAAAASDGYGFAPANHVVNDGSWISNANPENMMDAADDIVIPNFSQEELEIFFGIVIENTPNYSIATNGNEELELAAQGKHPAAEVAAATDVVAASYDDDDDIVIPNFSQEELELFWGIQDAPISNIATNVNEELELAAQGKCPAAEVAAATDVVAASNADDGVLSNSNSKGNGLAAADNKDHQPPRVLTERKRRIRMRDLYIQMHALMPDIPKNVDKATLVEEMHKFIQTQEKNKATLEKRKQELELAWQFAAGAQAGASSSSAVPQTAQGMAAMSSNFVPRGWRHDVPPPPPPSPQPLAEAAVEDISSGVPYGWCDVLPLPQQPSLAAAMAGMSSDNVVVLQPPPLAVPAPAPAPPQCPVSFQTWSWPNVVLNLLGDDAYIHMCSPRHLGMKTIVMSLSVLNNYGIEVVTAQVASNAERSLFTIFAHVTGMGAGYPSSEELYQLAVLEIVAFLNDM